MKDEKISDNKIDFEGDDTNSIFFEETKVQEIVKLEKRVNYLTFFILILICSFAAVFYFNLKKMMLEVKNSEAGRIDTLAKDIDSKIAILSAVNLDFKENTAKKIQQLQKTDNIVKKDFNKIKRKFKKVEKTLKDQPNREELKKLSDKIALLLKDRITADDLLKISVDSEKVAKTWLEKGVTKSELDEKIEVFDKDLRIKLLRLAGDTENMIANAKKGIERNMNKKLSELIKDLEISMQNYFSENLKQVQSN